MSYVARMHLPQLHRKFTRMVGHEYNNMVTWSVILKLPVTLQEASSSIYQNSVIIYHKGISDNNIINLPVILAIFSCEAEGTAASGCIVMP